MQPAEATYKPQFVFSLITLVYIGTYLFVFKGFNGTDDLHYAMLASRMLKGTYSPFVAGDIFSGRVLIIAWQALIYKVAGISVFTTQLSTLLAIVVSCYVTVFALLRANSAKTVSISTPLFYFSPLLTNSSRGPFPDIYIILAGVIILVLFNKSLQQPSSKKNILYGLCIGLVLTAGIFFKETILVFFILVVCLAFIYRSRQAAITSMAMLATLAVTGAAIALWYYHYTGDVFFRFKQIENSTYYNPCSYDLLPLKYLLARLTYTPWQGFIIFGLYPVVLAAGFIVYNLFLHKPFQIFKNPFIICFFILLLTGLYFPFSLHSYQPLCSDARHFLFLLPLAVCAITPYIVTGIEKSKPMPWAFICIVVCIICTQATQDKWQWLMWGLLACYFIFVKLVDARLDLTLKSIGFVAALWACMLYHVFFESSNWFASMRQLNKQLSGTHYYFADHDNMMHWKLLHGFNNSINSYDMDAMPYKTFQLYYDKLDTANFNPGWFIVNTKYTERSEAFLHTVDSLQQNKFFTRQVHITDVQAMYIQQPAQLRFIKQLVENDIKVMR